MREWLLSLFKKEGHEWFAPDSSEPLAKKTSESLEFLTVFHCFSPFFCPWANRSRRSSLFTKERPWVNCSFFLANRSFAHKNERCAQKPKSEFATLSRTRHSNAWRNCSQNPIVLYASTIRNNLKIIHPTPVIGRLIIGGGILWRRENNLSVVNHPSTPPPPPFLELTGSHRDLSRSRNITPSSPFLLF